MFLSSCRLSTQRGILDTPVAFWRSLMKHIYSCQGALAENEAKLASITLGSDGEGLFLTELTQPEKVQQKWVSLLQKNLIFDQLDQTKNVVLFFDEMDRLLDGPIEILNSFMGALRALRGALHSNLFGFIGLGTFRLHDIVSPQSGIHTHESPFNVSSMLQLSHFSLDEVKQLFLEFEKDSGVVLDPAIISDIFAITKG